MSELVVPNDTGYLSRAGDADDLRNGIEALLNDPVAVKLASAEASRSELRRNPQGSSGMAFVAPRR